MNRRNVISLLFALLMSFFVMLCIYFEYGHIDSYLVLSLLSEILVCELILFLSSYLCRVAHLLGYLVCGILSGYKFVSAEIFGFVFRKEEEHISVDRYRYTKSVRVAMEPPEYNDGNFSYALYSLGGVIIYSSLSFVLLICSGICFITWSYMPSAYFFCAFSICAANAVLYMLPVSKGNISVFTLMRLLNKNPENRRAYHNSLMITALIFKGMRLREQPRELFDVSDFSDLSGFITADMLWHRMCRFLDEGNLKDADEMIGYILRDETKLSVFTKNLAQLEKIYIELITYCREDVIKSLLTDSILDFMTKNSDRITVIRVEYALSLLYYYDNRAAEMHLERFRKKIEKFPYPADISFDMDLIEEAKNKIK